VTMSPMVHTEDTSSNSRTSSFRLPTAILVCAGFPSRDRVQGAGACAPDVRSPSRYVEPFRMASEGVGASRE
jgi:hypothetical protein